jgi:hypothetical protein
MLKPQDIPILLKTYLWQDQQWRYSDLAESLSMSASEVHSSLKRSTDAKLYNPLTHQPLTPHLLELLIHGLKYIYPAIPGTLVRGMPTAHSISPLKEQIVSSQEPLVWAFAAGTEIGLALIPLYPSVPLAASLDPQLYELLGLVDALRVGRIREQQLAAVALQERLGVAI